MNVHIDMAQMVALTYLQYNWGVWKEQGFVQREIESVDLKTDNYWIADWFRGTVRFEATVNGYLKAEINLRREDGRWIPASAAPLNFAKGPMQRFVPI